MGQKPLWKIFQINDSQELAALRSCWQANQATWKKYHAFLGPDGEVETDLPYLELQRWFRSAINKPIPDHHSSAYSSLEDQPIIEEGAEYVDPAYIAQALEFENITPVRRYCREGAIPAIKEKRIWFIKKEDADEFIARYRAGEIGQSRKGMAHPDHPLHGIGPSPDPDSLASQGKQSQVRIPATEGQAKWLREMIPPAERLAILDYYARMKEDDPAGYEAAMKGLKNGA